MVKGTLYLVPSPLGDNSPSEVIPLYVFNILCNIKFFAVEEIRTARRYLSSIGFKGKIDTLSFYEINEHTTLEDVDRVTDILLQGFDVALISEAGLPAVADPGAQLVESAHNHDITVVPFVGPSSLMLALMSSGMNGQQFAFSGYLPVKGGERREKIKELERFSSSKGQTQIFIETPYRNDSLFEDILNVCNPETKICIAADITLPSQYIKTRSVKDWKKNLVTIGKRPCVFLLLA
jgi:16S rRNA (cytidine1402-2'-O)-methyltransferase